MSDATEMKQATPQHLARVAELGEPLANYIQQHESSHFGMEILLYVIVRCFMDINPYPGTSHLDAFDTYMKAARHTLEKNLEHAGATKQ